MSFFYAMLEAGMCVIAVNLPSLWLFFTSLMPEKLVQSVRSMISLSSQRPSRLDSATANSAAASGSTTHLSHKPDAASSIDSTRPDLPSDLSQLHYHQEQLSGNASGHRVETIAMHDVQGREQQGEKKGVPRGQIHVENTVELSRHERQRAGDEFC